MENPIRLDIGGEELKRVHEVKYLGVPVDESLSWTIQYKELKSKLKSGLSSILKLKNILPQTKLETTKLMFRNILLLSIFAHDCSKKTISGIHNKQDSCLGLREILQLRLF